MAGEAQASDDGFGGDVAGGDMAGADAASGDAAGADVLVYKTRWCGASRAALRFLDKHGIAYRAVDIDEDEEAAALVQALNRGNRSVPTIMINGVHAMTEPSRQELGKAFGVSQD